MKRIVTGLCAALICAVGLTGPAQAEPEIAIRSGTIEIDLLSSRLSMQTVQNNTPVGQVQTIRPGTLFRVLPDGTREPLEVASMVFQNDVLVTTDGGYAEVTMFDFNTVTIDGGSRVDFSLFELAGDRPQFTLVRGFFVYLSERLSRNRTIEQPVMGSTGGRS